MNNVWSVYGADYQMSESTNQMNILPKGVYKLMKNPMTGAFYVTRISDSFEFNYKVYATETKFINHVMTTWNNMDENLGLLLDGVKGTGKTITAQQIANATELPIIIVPFNYEGLTNFLNNLQQDTVIFIDEYDKIFERYSNSLLTVMDGVLKTSTRLMFLLTSNNDYLDTNMVMRPSRIRYIKKFGNMSLATIIEVVDDMLIHTQWRKDCIKVISGLHIITMDLVKSIIEEVNVHNMSPYEFKSFMNIEKPNEEKRYNIFMFDKENNKRLISNDCKLYDDPLPNAEFNLGNAVTVKSESFHGTLGTLNSILPDGRYVLSYDPNNPELRKALGEKVPTEELEDYEFYEQDETKFVNDIFMFEEVKKTHSAFYGYAF